MQYFLWGTILSSRGEEKLKPLIFPDFCKKEGCLHNTILVAYASLLCQNKRSVTKKGKKCDSM